MGKGARAQHPRPPLGSPLTRQPIDTRKNGCFDVLAKNFAFLIRRTALANKSTPSTSVAPFDQLTTSSLCALCKSIKLNDSDHGGYLRFSKRSGKYVHFPNSMLRLNYQIPGTSPSLLSISANADSDCQFCQLLKTSFMTFLKHDLQISIGLECIAITGLQYHWADGLRSLAVEFQYSRQSYIDDHRFQFPIKAYPGPCTQYLRIPKSPRYERLLLENHSLLLEPVSRRIQSWIEHCLQHCDPYTDPEALPTRLLDVGNTDGTGKVRLLVANEQTTRDGTRKPMRYAALSHCWGNPAFDKPPLRTTRDNVNKRLENIPFWDLPQNYKDAIIVCRSLNIGYLWIDSLCIIQDNKTDWERESPRMAQYYEHAYITIIPAAATSSHDGFLDRAFTEEPRAAVEFQSSLDHGIKGTYFIDHDGIEEPESSLFYQEVAESKWGTRGWTFCEGLFSKRRVYFGKNTIHWSCRKFYSSELSNSMHDAEEHNLESLIEEQDPSRGSNDLSIWYTQYLEYSCRDFTISQDRLPGISPLAKVMADMTGDKYLAGLWESDLHVGLLWYASSFDGPIVLPGGKDPPYIAPSWSWLARARNAEVNDYVLTYDTQSCLRVLEAGTTQDGINPFGRVLDGFIKVRGRCLELPRNNLKKAAHGRERNQREIWFQGIHIGECFLDLSDFDVDSRVDFQLPILGTKVQSLTLLVVRGGLCLKGAVSRAREDTYEEKEKVCSAVSGLVLISSGRREDEFCRAGIFESLPVRGGGKMLFEDRESREITII